MAIREYEKKIGDPPKVAPRAKAGASNEVQKQLNQVLFRSKTKSSRSSA
jgi:hypothetical protein